MQLARGLLPPWTPTETRMGQGTNGQYEIGIEEENGADRYSR